MNVSSVKNNPMGSQQVLLLCVALVSASVLMLEITLTRTFSIIFDYHYAFLLISLSILGLGAGGIFIHKIQKVEYEKFIEKILPISSGLMAFFVLALIIAIIKTPIRQIPILVVILAIIPFFFGGLFIASVFRVFPNKGYRVYAADLLGASLGTIVVLASLKLGVISSTLLITAIASLPLGILLVVSQVHLIKKLTAIIFVSILVLLLILNITFRFLGEVPLGSGPSKGMYHMIKNAEDNIWVVDSRWSAFGRTDLVLAEGNPERFAFFVDGSAGSRMFEFDGSIENLKKTKLPDSPESFPLKIIPLEKKKKVLIIGSGGGREILAALAEGAEEITAVEVNRDLVNMVRKYSEYNGGIYSDLENTKVVIEEGRNFIRRSKEKYDVIMLSQPVTRSSRSLNGYALTENYLFTEESINDYLDHLNPEGRLSIVTHGAGEVLRLLMTSLSAFKGRGIDTSAAMNHIYTIGPQDTPLFVLKKTPFTPQEAEIIHDNMHKLSFEGDTVFIPFIDQMTIKAMDENENLTEYYMLNVFLLGLSEGVLSPSDVINGVDIDISPVTDDTPFFYKSQLGLPAVLKALIVISLIAMGIAFTIRPKDRAKRRKIIKTFRPSLLFTFLGVGFMLVEIPLIQKFTLFLGQPVYAMTVLLFSLLIGVGLGSIVSGSFWKSGTNSKIRLASITVAALVLAFIVFQDNFLDLFLGFSFFARVVLSFSLLMPLGFFMGIPFPTGVKYLDELELADYIPKMWGINGIGSVFGSTLAIAIAINFGLSFAMALGAIFYISIFLLFSIKIQPVRA